MLLSKLAEGQKGSATASVFKTCVTCIFHILLLMFTFYVLIFLYIYASDVFPTCIPSSSQAVRTTAVVLIAKVIFLGFQLAVGTVWLPKPCASRAACEAACTQAGRPHVPSECRVYRWYALPANIVGPVVSAVVSMVVHAVADVIGYYILTASGVDCDHIVNEQLSRSGGSNMSCGTTEVDMVSYVSGLVANSSQGTPTWSYSLCSSVGIRDRSVCSSVCYIGIPFCTWIVLCMVLVLVPLLASMQRQRPCQGCAVGA